MIEEARRFVPTVRRFYHQAIQDFVFEDKYDSIWMQWIFMYLSDREAIEFLVIAAE